MTERDKEDFSLVRFVKVFQLPHRAVVTEGYYEEGDIDNNREFSNGDVIDIRRVICPLVRLTFRDPVSQNLVTVSVSTRNQNIQFHVLTKKDTTINSKPEIFRSVQQLVDRWPLTVRCLADHITFRGPGNQSIQLQKEDELRLIRVVAQTSDGSFLECSVQRNQQLIQLPLSGTGSFLEVNDPNSYTMQELIDMAWVERDLKIDYSATMHYCVPNGIPKNYSGVLHMEKPEVFSELSRVLREDDDLTEKVCDPILVPICCEIRLSARDATYMPVSQLFFKLQNLRSLDSKTFPVVARIIGWKEHSGILLNHVTRPGDQVIIYGLSSIDKILCHCDKKYFLLPISNQSSFFPTNAKTPNQKRINLTSIERELPCIVNCQSANSNINARNSIPFSEFVSFDALITDECILVSKVFGDVMGNGFYLPLRTDITVQLVKRLNKGYTNPCQMSKFDSCAEEISESVYNQMRLSKMPAPVPPERQKSLKLNESLRRRPPPDPHTDYQGYTEINDSAFDDNLKFLMNSTCEKTSIYDDYYSYIDIAAMELGKRRSEGNEKHDGVVIPVNGDISNFTYQQMIRFLEENHVSLKILTTWKKEKSTDCDSALIPLFCVHG